MRSIGVFGGTFDPVHYGHIQLAQAACKEIEMGELLFLPSASPPHKEREFVCSYDHRSAMLRLATDNNKLFSVSDLESRLPSPSYTYDTLEYMRTKDRRGAPLFFVIGSDAFLEIESWYRWRDLLLHTMFVVAVRPGSNQVAVVRFLKRHGFIKPEGRARTWIRIDSQGMVILLTCETQDISSTDLRSRIRKRLRWDHLVPKKVAEYIKRHSLYYTDPKPA